MGGKIGVESEEGKGSCFWFEATFESGLTTLFARSELKHKRALVVVEDRYLSRSLNEQLSLRGIDCEIAVCAKDVDGHGPFDFILIDGQFLNKNEGELIHRIESNPKLANTPLRLLTFRGDKIPNLPLAVQVSVIKKPIRQSDLYKTIADLIHPKRGDEGGSKMSEHENPENKPTSPLKSVREPILVVEDNEVNEKVVRKMVERLGLRMDSVSGGKEAIEMVGRKAYCLILMDCQMTGMDGFETTQKIRALGGDYSRIPIVAVTAYALKGDREKCGASGMDDYLTKPLRSGELKKTLLRWLAPGVTEGFDETPKADTEPNLPLLDSSILNDLRALNEEGEEDFLNELIDTYLSVSPKILDELGTAIESKRATAIAHLAHRLKGMSYNLGAKTVAKWCDALETKGREGKVGDLEFFMRSLRKEWIATKEALEKDWRIAV